MFAVVSSAQQAVDSLGNALGDASVTHVGIGELERKKRGERPFCRDCAGHTTVNPPLVIIVGEMRSARAYIEIGSGPL